MAIADRVTELVEPLLLPLDLQLYDVELNGGTLRITVDGPGGVNLDRVAQATRAISNALDEADPMPGKYTLEVSSPGLERRLRASAHFLLAVGETISVKLGPQVDGPRRVNGQLAGVEEDQIIVVDHQGESTALAFADITKATTVFEWGPGPKPGQPGAKKGTAPSKDTAKQTDDPSNPSESERTASAR